MGLKIPKPLESGGSEVRGNIDDCQSIQRYILYYAYINYKTYECVLL
jgi:hypothetical protein